MVRTLQPWTPLNVTLFAPLPPGESLPPRRRGVGEGPGQMRLRICYKIIPGYSKPVNGDV